MRLSNITSLSNVVDSHRPLLQRVREVGQSLLQRSNSLPSRQAQSNIDTDLTQLDAMWHQLETVVHQQKQQLEALNAGNSERQVLSLFFPLFSQFLVLLTVVSVFFTNISYQKYHSLSLSTYTVSL